LRELAYIPFTVLGLLQAKFRWKEIDIVHINEVTNLLSIMLAKLIFNCPIIVHVRSVQQTQGSALRKRLVHWVLGMADTVIAIDMTVRRSLPETIDVQVVHNGFNHTQGKQQKRNYADNSFSEKPMVVTFVGSLSIMKGIVELLDAAKLCKKNKLNIEFLIVGEAPRKLPALKAYIYSKLGLSIDIDRYCREFIKENQLENTIKFSGFTMDIESVYLGADVLCFPSHLNAVGRPVIEAAIYKVPSIVSIDHLSEDTIIDKSTGICIKEKSADDLFGAIKYFYEQPHEIHRMGLNSFDLAQENFNIHENAKRVVGIYQSAIQRRF